MVNREVYIIGGDHYNTLGVVRSLGEEGVYSHVLIQDHHGKSFVLASRYVKYGKVCENDDEVLRQLQQKRWPEKPIIYCCSDKALVFVISNNEQLSKTFILPVCSDINLSKSFLGKDFITDYAKQFGVNVPLSWTSRGRRIPDKLVYPVITKPLSSLNGKKSDMVVCGSENELKDVLNSPNHCEDYQIQQYIEYEKEISILGCVLPDGEVVFSGCIDKLRTCMIGTSSYAVMLSNALLGDEKNHLEKMLRSSHYSGLFSAEYLLKDGIYYFLEVNFRNDGNTYVATKAGVNLPFIWYASNCGNRIDVGEGHYPCFFMLEIEDFIARKINRLSLSQWNKDRKCTNAFLVFNKDDIKPYKIKVCKVVAEYMHSIIAGIKRRLHI